MEITSEEPLNIVSQLLIPILLVILTVILTGLIQLCFNIYLNLNEKNKYIKHLKANFPSVKEFTDTVKHYKIDVVHGLSYLYFVLGIIVGFLIELILGTIIVTIFSHTFDRNYIGKLLNLSSDDVFLNMLAIIYSLFNIGIIIIVILFIRWDKSFNSKKLLIPKIDEHGRIKPSSYSVYISFWAFIGMVFGLYLTIILYFIGTLSKLSIIGNNLSFDRVQFDLTYAHLLFPGVHAIVYMIGFIISLTFILILYINAKQFKEGVIKSITDFYQYDFPYVKIKTESGEIQGQLRDILDKYLVTLSENNILKIVQWDKIETMEISPKNKKELCIFNDPFTK